MAKFIGKAKYIVFGMIMNLCLGSVYSWSIFRKPVEKAFEGIEVGYEFNYSGKGAEV